MPGELLFISERPEDIAFGQTIAGSNGMKFISATTVSEVERLRNEYPDMVVLWDVDHAKAAIAGDPTSVKLVGKALMEALPPDRVFAVSDKPLKETPHLFGIPAFGHHLYRQFNDPAAPISSWLTQACVRDEPFGLVNYLPPETKIQKLKLSRSGQRASVVGAVQNVFTKKGIPPRLVSLVVQAVDELLMNALFDAPMNAQGERYRRMVTRSDDFELNEVETVNLEMGETERYIAVSVSDRFGSLDKDVVLNFIRKDYSKENYQVQDDSPSAGLGIYAILGSGLSLLFISRYKTRTEVILFFPVVDNFRSFRESFRFFSFILR